MNGREQDKKSSNRVLLIIAGIVALVVALAVIAAIVFFGNGNADETEADVKETIKVVIEETIEYGEDIKDKTFTFNTEDEEKEAKFTDLSPEVDTMKIGKTEHQLEMEEEIFDVTVIVEDTNNPVISGVEDVIELEGEEVDIEKELKKIITAEDPVDGELEVVFQIEEDEDNENHYDVTAEATDVNDNKTTEKFKVTVKIVEKEEEKSSSEGTVAQSENNTSTSKQEKKQEKPKQEQPKQEQPKQEKSKEEKPKQEKPKQEEKKEEKQPEPQDDFGAPPLNSPSGIPSGATLSQKITPGYHLYSYSGSLPGGGSITEVMVSSNYGGVVQMTGTDNDGNSFISDYYVGDGNIYHQVIGPMSKPQFTQDDISLLFELGREFARAYGLQ